MNQPPYQQPGQYPPQPGQYPPQPGQYPPQPGQYPPQPGQYPPQPGQYPPQGAPYGQPQAPYGQPQAPYGQPQVDYGQSQAPYGQPGPQYAGLGLRIVAYLIDSAIIAVASWIIGFIFGLFIAAAAANSDNGAAAGGLLVLLWLVVIVLVLGYFVYMEATQGATLGKKALGLRIVKVDGSPIGWSEAIIRTLLRIVDNFFFGLVGLICIAATEKQQRVGDMAAKTIVIKTR